MPTSRLTKVTAPAQIILDKSGLFLTSTNDPTRKLGHSKSNRKKSIPAPRSHTGLARPPILDRGDHISRFLPADSNAASFDKLRVKVPQ